MPRHRPQVYRQIRHAERAQFYVPKLPNLLILASPLLHARMSPDRHVISNSTMYDRSGRPDLQQTVVTASLPRRHNAVVRAGSIRALPSFASSVGVNRVAAMGACSRSHRDGCLSGRAGPPTFEAARGPEPGRGATAPGTIFRRAGDPALCIAKQNSPGESRPPLRYGRACRAVLPRSGSGVGSPERPADGAGFLTTRKLSR